VLSNTSADAGRLRAPALKGSRWLILAAIEEMAALARIHQDRLGNLR
jgi:hypothetical protein